MQRLEWPKTLLSKRPQKVANNLQGLKKIPKNCNLTNLNVANSLGDIGGFYLNMCNNGQNSAISAINSTPNMQLWVI